MIRIVLGFGGFLLPLFPFGFFFPLVSPWRLRYKRMAMGGEDFGRCPNGKATIRVGTTQSCPQ